MSRFSRSARSESFSLHVHSEDVLYAALSSLWRRKLLIATLVCAALGIGIAVAILMPQRYTAEAFIRGVATASDAMAKVDEGRNAALVTLDMGRLIETQSILLQSHQLARRVIERLGLQRLQSEVDNTGWLALPGHRQDDSAAARLLSHLAVTTDPRAYLITLNYTSRDPDLAALVANTFVAEILRSIELQILSQQRFATQTSLSERLAQFGNKFPSVIQARLNLAAIDGLLEKWQSASSDEILRSAGENVTPVTVLPSSRRRLVVALHVLFGLVIGIGTALWLERSRWWGALSNTVPEGSKGCANPRPPKPRARAASGCHDAIFGATALGVIHSRPLAVQNPQSQPLGEPG